MLIPPRVRRHQRARTARQVRLPGGRRVGVRPIRAADADEFARAYTRLSELSRQRRFLSAAATLSPAEARYLTSVDHDEHVAFVAALPDSDEILGSARYIRLPSRPGVAEMAVEVIDEWQRHGVGRALLEALSQHAQAAGIDRFVAVVAADNAPMQRLLRRAGATAVNVDGELEYTVDVGALAPAPEPHCSRRGRSQPRQRVVALLAGAARPV